MLATVSPSRMLDFKFPAAFVDVLVSPDENPTENLLAKSNRNLLGKSNRKFAWKIQQKIYWQNPTENLLEKSNRKFTGVRCSSSESLHVRVIGQLPATWSCGSLSLRDQPADLWETKRKTLIYKAALLVSANGSVSRTDQKLVCIFGGYAGSIIRRMSS